MFEVLNQLVEKKKQVDLELRTEGEKALKSVLKEFIGKHPSVKCIYWNQYTPYFNDGEPCVFGISDICVGLDKEHPLVGFWTWKGETRRNGAEYEATVNGNEIPAFTCGALVDSDLKTDLKKLSGIMQSLDSVLEATFGDGVEIIVTSDSIEINDYSHD